MEPPKNGHVWDPLLVVWPFCPLLRGCPLSEVIGKSPFGTLKLILCSEFISVVSLIQSVLYQRFHCMLFGCEKTANANPNTSN